MEFAAGMQVSFGAAQVGSEQGIKRVPAAVRNTRRSIGEGPYLPLPSSPQPPELHHFR